MPAATPLPKQGDVFFDRQRSERTLRLSPHPAAGIVVLSIWSGGVCQATFQLPGDQVELFAETLRTTAPSPAPPPARSPALSPAPPPAPPAPGVPGAPPAAPGPEAIRTGDYDTQPNIA